MDVNAGQLYRLARLLQKIAQQATAKPGERSPTAGTLAIVEDVHTHPDCAIKDIVARTGLAQSLVSRTIEQLHQAGVVDVAKNPADARSTLVTIRPKTRKDFLERGDRPISAALAEALPELTSVQRRRIMTALDVLAAELLTRPSPRQARAHTGRNGAD